MSNYPQHAMVHKVHRDFIAKTPSGLAYLLDILRRDALLSDCVEGAMYATALDNTDAIAGRPIKYDETLYDGTMYEVFYRDGHFHMAPGLWLLITHNSTHVFVRM